MKKKSIPIKALLSALLISTSSVTFASGENMLKDASFEQRLSPDNGGWTLFDYSNYSSDEARTGKGSMFNWGFSRTVPVPPFLRGTVSGSFQEFPASPGSRWRLTGYGMTPIGLKGAPAYGIVQVSFFDDEGNDLGTVETAKDDRVKAKTSNQLNAAAAADQWVLLDTGIATAPANATKIHAFTLFVDYSGSGISQGVYFDDLKLCALDPGDADGSGCD